MHACRQYVLPSEEFTFRLVKNGQQAPGWPFSLLEFLARHTRTKYHPFDVDDRIDRGGPITDAVTTTLVALAVSLDPTLPPTTSDNGAFEFRGVRPYRPLCTCCSPRRRLVDVRAGGSRAPGTSGSSGRD